VEEIQGQGTYGHHLEAASYSKNVFNRWLDKPSKNHSLISLAKQQENGRFLYSKATKLSLGKDVTINSADNRCVTQHHSTTTMMSQQGIVTMSRETQLESNRDPPHSLINTDE